MSFENYQKYHLSLGTNSETVRIVKQLLQSKSDNSYRDDGSSEYTTQLAGAVRELQSRNGLPITGNVGQSEYWLLGKNVLDVHLEHLSKNDRALNTVLRGGILGNALVGSSPLLEGGDDGEIDKIKYIHDYWLEWTFDNRTVRNPVTSDTQTVLNNTGSALATNVVRAIGACNALIEYPKVSTKMGLTGSVTVEGSATVSPTGTGGAAGGKVIVGGYYDEMYDSTDSVMRKLRMTNDAIRFNSAMAISTHTISVPNADPKISEVMKPLGETPANDASNLALSLVNWVAKDSNSLARENYKNFNRTKSIPPMFWNLFTGDIIF